MEVRELGISDKTLLDTNFNMVITQGETDLRKRYELVLSKEEANEISSEPTFTYGEYPHSLVGDDEETKAMFGATRHELENAFREMCVNNKTGRPTERKFRGGVEVFPLQETDKEYTVMGVRVELKKFKEYEYNGRKYVRVSPAVDVPVGTSKVVARNPVWFCVQPITWTRTEDGRAVTTDYSWISGRCWDRSHPHYISEEEWKPKFDMWFENKFSKDILKWGTVAVDANERTPIKRRRRGFGVMVDDTPMSVKEQMTFYINNRMCFILEGPPGVGKSRRVYDLDPDYQSITLAKGVDADQVLGRVCYPDGFYVDPYDEKGKQVELSLDKGRACWIPPHWYQSICEKCAAEPDKVHIIFADEATNASPHQQGLLLDILAKRYVFGSYGKLPENSVVILAGNSVNNSSAAYNPIGPLATRPYGTITLRPDIQEWLEWGSQPSTKYPNEPGRLNVHPLVAAFVGAYGDQCFYIPYDEENPSRTMNPRSWEQISDIIYSNNGVLRQELLFNKMGKLLKDAFYGFAKNPPLTAEDVLDIISEKKENLTDEDIKGLKLPQKPDEKMALIYSLRRVDERHVGQVRSFIHRCLKAEYRSVFDKVWCDGKPERAIFLKRLDDRMNGGSSR